jgi:hypothetical protein
LPFISRPIASTPRPPEPMFDLTTIGLLLAAVLLIAWLGRAEID